MKAMRFHEYGEPEVLRVEEVDVPVPGTGQVLVRVAATSFNSVDAQHPGRGHAGPHPLDLPHVPGLDVAGTVEAVGEGVSGLRSATRSSGSCPSPTTVPPPSWSWCPRPRSPPPRRASRSSTPRPSRWSASPPGRPLFEHADLRAGQRVLVTGAERSRGRYAVQLAAAAGAHVIATARARPGPGRAPGPPRWSTRTTTSRRARRPGRRRAQPGAGDPAQLAGFLDLVADGGHVVSTTVWMPAPSDEARDVHGVDVFVRSDAGQLAELVARVDRGELAVEVAEQASRWPTSRTVHARAATGAPDRQGRRHARYA